jgi:hypothetical protein
VYYFEVATTLQLMQASVCVCVVVFVAAYGARAIHADEMCVFIFSYNLQWTRQCACVSLYLLLLFFS